jgi:hypothetical protein
MKLGRERERGEAFDLATYLIHNQETFRKHVSYVRPQPHVMLPRVNKVYDSFRRKKDKDGKVLFTDVNDKEWEEFLVHVVRFVNL